MGEKTLFKTKVFRQSFQVSRFCGRFLREIFDKIMKISRSPDLELTSPDFLQESRDSKASTVDRQFCHSSRRNDFQFGEFCLKPFANCVVIEKIQRTCVVCRPRKTPYWSGHGIVRDLRDFWFKFFQKHQIWLI